MEIDYEKLRNDLIDYFGTAMMYNPMAIEELNVVERVSDDMLIQVAIQNGFDLTNYQKQRKR